MNHINPPVSKNVVLVQVLSQVSQSVLLFYCGPAQLTTDRGSLGGSGGDHFTLLYILSLRSETKTNRRKLAMITSDRSMFCKLFCLVQMILKTYVFK